jgi:hypothetical protein
MIGEPAVSASQVFNQQSEINNHPFPANGIIRPMSNQGSIVASSTSMMGMSSFTA